MRTMVLELFEWWRHPERLAPEQSTALRDKLATDFVFDSGLEILSKDDFAHAIDRTWAPWRKVELLDVVVDESDGIAAILFQGTDTATNLLYRASWFFSFRDGLVQTIRAVYAMVPEPERSQPMAQS